MPLLKDEVVQSSVEGVYAEEELKEFGKKFQTLFNLMPDPVVIVDAKGKFLAVNDKMEEKTGFKREELLGKDFLWTKIVTERSKAIMMENLIKRMMGMPVAPYEVELLTKDGKKETAEINATRIEYEGKLASLAIFRDITERKRIEQALRMSASFGELTIEWKKQTEEALRESEEKYRNLFENARDAIITLDLKGNAISVNKVAAEYGFKEDEIVGKSMLKFVSKKYQSRLLKELAKMTRGNPVEGEIELITPKGKVIMEYRSNPIRRGKEVVGSQAILRDITERKKMEEKLRQYSERLEELVQKRTEELLQSEKRYSVLVEEASDGVVIIQDEKIVFANKKAREIVGYSREEQAEIPFEKLVDEKYQQLTKERYVRKLRGETGPTTIEIEVTAKTGERVPVELSGALINYQGRPAILVIVRDIRERKRMEEERLRLEKLATIGEIATMVGHDLRNPLQSIENAAYYLTNKLSRHPTTVPIPPKAIEMLQAINDSVDYADKIIRNLHDFSTTKKPILKKTSINAIIKKTLSQVKAPENVELITELGHLPEIKVDKDEMKRVFLNLAINGVQAMKKGGTLKVSTKKTKEFVEVKFEDTGVGIPKENMKKIFTPFFTTRAKGMGMGLPICKKFVESHGGSIEVESEEGKGTTFTVKLPIQQDNGGENQ